MQNLWRDIKASMKKSLEQCKREDTKVRKILR